MRRIHSSPGPTEDDADFSAGPNIEQDKQVLGTLEEECWVGPDFSTALDVFFQPLYIGGALADDRSILLGDLCFNRERSSQCVLQYVHDFGCWWSHTIEVEISSEQPRTDGSVAILLSGEGPCPPDDSGGVIAYHKEVMKLAGQLPDGESELDLDPSCSQWWETLNSVWRSKGNNRGLRNPFIFDLESHCRAVADALSRPLVKKGSEHLRAIHQQFKSGLSGTASGPGGPKPEVHKKVTDPTRFCAVCGVTAGLMLCSGCRSIAFCGRAHQLEYWPKHKAACRATQEMLQSSRGNKGTKKDY